MKKNSAIALIVVAIVIIGGAIALSSSKPKSNDHGSMKADSSKSVEKPADPNTVLISNYTFSPNPLKVKKGTMVTWTNRDIAKHSVTVDNGQPAGGPGSDLFGKGQSYSFTFATVGTFKYHCDPHPYMHGVVEVTE